MVRSSLGDLAFVSKPGRQGSGRGLFPSVGCRPLMQIDVKTLGSRGAATGRGNKSQLNNKMHVLLFPPPLSHPPLFNNPCLSPTFPPQPPPPAPPSPLAFKTLSPSLSLPSLPSSLPSLSTKAPLFPTALHLLAPPLLPPIPLVSTLPLLSPPASSTSLPIPSVALPRPLLCSRRSSRLLVEISDV